jgi:hypothetical protein
MTGLRARWGVLACGVWLVACGGEAPSPSARRNDTNTINAPRQRQLTAAQGWMAGNLGPVRNLDTAATFNDATSLGQNTLALFARGTFGAVLVTVELLDRNAEFLSRTGTLAFAGGLLDGNSAWALNIRSSASQDPERDLNFAEFNAEATHGTLTVQPWTEPDLRRFNVVAYFPNNGGESRLEFEFLLAGTLEDVDPGVTTLVPPPATVVTTGATLVGSVGPVVDIQGDATVESSTFGDYLDVMVTVRDPQRGVAMSIITLFMPLYASTLVPGTRMVLDTWASAGGNAAYSVSVMGCSDLDPTTAPLEVAFDQPAEGGELVVEEGPTPDTRILSVTSHYGVNTSAPQLLEARFKVQL